MLLPLEREILELMTLVPAIGRRVAEEIEVEHLSHPGAQQLLMIARELAVDGRVPDFQSLMTRVEDPKLKYLLIELAEAAEAKNEQALFDADERFQEALNVLKQQSADDESRRVIADLESKRLDEKEQVDALRRLIEQQRARQGISAPTDG